ncbi:hypothetical protein HMPREF9005_1707 [Actinomyces sp. oral taxon 178 str. F0338]|nr:hypothetical protein HMPREF9005_1707 [Actinomyces sp. oral taxon 178 str. F0338]
MIGAVNAVTALLDSLVAQAADEFDEMARALLVSAQSYETTEEELSDGFKRFNDAF